MKQAEDMCHLPMHLKDIDAMFLFLLEVELLRNHRGTSRHGCSS